MIEAVVVPGLMLVGMALFCQQSAFIRDDFSFFGCACNDLLRGSS